MGVVGAAIKGFGKALKVAKRNKESKKLFEKSKKKYIKRDPHEGLPSQSSDWPYWRGEE